MIHTAAYSFDSHDIRQILQRQGLSVPLNSELSIVVRHRSVECLRLPLDDIEIVVQINPPSEADEAVAIPMQQRTRWVH